MTQDTFTIAYQLHTWGYSVIPSGGGDTGKQPLIDWKQYQTKQPSDEQLEEWNRTLRPALWGIVTNSTIAVIDADTTETRVELEGKLGQPHVTTPRGGAHWYINTAGHPFPTKSNILPGIDVRGEGGFVNIVGGEYQILTLPHPDTLIPYEELPEHIQLALNNKKPTTIKDGEPILEGKRNDTLTSIAGTLRNRGLSQAAIERALLGINSAQCQPPLEDAEVQRIAQSIATYPPTYPPNHGINRKNIHTLSKNGEIASKPNKNLTENITVTVSMEDIEAWVRQTSGWFTNEELDRELGYVTPKQKQTRLVYMRRLAERGIIQRHPTNNKLSRFLARDVRLIDFKAAGKREPLEIGLPFDIHKLVHIYPGNIIVLAGVQNAGKTAFMLNVIRLNMHFFPVQYMSSEMGAEELALRLEKFPGIDLCDWNFTSIERTRDFADVIMPDAINIIDYYEFTNNEAFYHIAEGLRAIWENLGSGIALVAIQKSRNKQAGRGGDFGLEKPRLYLAMDPGRITIVKAKNWADPNMNPNGLVLDFKLANGCEFAIIKDWHRGDD